MMIGCLLLVDRPTCRRLGGFDKRYFAYRKDADQVVRAHRLSLRPIITPTAEVVHAFGESSGGEAGSMPLKFAGLVTYLRTHYREPARLLAVALGPLGTRLTGRVGKWLAAWRCRTEWWNGFPGR